MLKRAQGYVRNGACCGLFSLGKWVRKSREAFLRAEGRALKITTTLMLRSGMEGERSELWLWESELGKREV